MIGDMEKTPAVYAVDTRDEVSVTAYAGMDVLACD